MLVPQNSHLLLSISLIFVGGLLLSKCLNEQPRQVPNENRVVVDYQKVSIEEATKLTGLDIPLPAYLPAGYTLDGVYVYYSYHRLSSDKTNNNSEEALSSRRPGTPFQIRYRNDHGDWLIMRLYGGDTRNEEVYLNTGEGIPLVFGLTGEKIKINGNDGVLQVDLEEQSFTSNGARLRSRLVWRLPYKSSIDPNLKAIFLSLESIGLENDPISTSILLDVAESVYESP